MDFIEYISILNSNLCILKGVGEKKSALFAKLGINTIADLIYFFPRTYEDRTNFCLISDAISDAYCCIKARPVRKVIERKIKKNVSLYNLKIEDKTGIMNVKWFSSPFNRVNVKVGGEYVFYGKISSKNSREMDLVTFEPLGENNQTGCIIPIYSSTGGLTQNDIRKAVKNAFSLIGSLADPLPLEIVSKNNFIKKDEAVRTMHNPEDFDKYNRAKKRLAYEELFILILALMRIKSVNKTKTSVVMKNIKCALDFSKTLPYELTADQKNAINEICQDFISGYPMSRLLQGDVGSGKTVVAAVSAYIAAKNKYQTAIMAPTEILANQHYETFKKFFENHNINLALLTSSSNNKKEISEKIKAGEIDIVIGTHALLEDYVEFSRLGLCITDEQHRFGVKQRSGLTHGEKYPHVLVMSATPIPRTLSLIIYGDLDVSVIASAPRGRKPVDTFCVNTSLHERIYDFMRKNISDGHQCFVVCPLVEDSDKIDANSSTGMFESMSEIFGKERVLLIHGKMNANEKDKIMQDFRDKKADVLVATTVIEVGIDIPNANIIVIENAERFGLSQLHQLRGRVGRGTDKSYCILVTDNTTEKCVERMKIMCSVKDGFELSKKDLELRGCGEFFGTRQHGLPELKIANLFTDMEIVNKAKYDCEIVLKNDPELLGKEYESIRKKIDEMFDSYGGIEILN